MRGKSFVLAPMLIVLLVMVTRADPAAAATTLCKEPWSPLACPVGERYAAGTELHAAAYGIEVKLIAGMLTVACPASEEGSSLILKTKEVQGAPLHGEITEFSFGGCSGCTSVTAIHLNYATELERTTPGKGTLTLKDGGSGNPSLKIAGCPGGVSCIYKAEALVARMWGGKPATLLFENSPMTKESGGCAATEAFFLAQYFFPWGREDPEAKWTAEPAVWVEKT